MATHDGAALRIRPGTARDLRTIWALIRSLAAYERLSHAVVATPGRLRRHGFGRRPYFKTLLCFRGNEPVGLALYFFAYSTFLARPTLYLEDLFVLPRHRGNGAGRALLEALARLALRSRCGRMEWTVLNWNAPAKGFYRRLGAAPLDGWTLMRLGGDSLRRLARGRGGHRAGSMGATPPRGRMGRRPETRKDAPALRSRARRRGRAPARPNRWGR